MPTPKPVTAAVADPDGRSLVTVDADGVRVWDLTAVPLIHDRDRLDLHPRLVYPVTGAARVAALDGGRLAVAVEDGIHVVGPDGHELFRAAGLHAEALAFDPRHHQLAAADAHGVIRVLSVGPGGELAVQAVLTGHTDAVHALSFSPDGRTLASGGADRRVLLWDPVTGHERAALAAHADRVIHVRFTADGLGLVTIDRGGTVRRWRTEAPQPKKPPGPPPPTPPGMQRIKK
ncbi:MAG: hypothetical protein K2P78_07170 [Gemmataceae bacterium]|nr:hypothetical protein [Gemmataceae bacterium]